MLFLWIVMGAVLGGLASEGGLAGIVGGAALGFVLGRQLQLSRELKELRARLQQTAPLAETTRTVEPTAAAERPWMSAQEVRDALQTPPPVTAAVAAPPARSEPPAAPRPEPAAPSGWPATTAAPRAPSPLDRLLKRAGRWFTEGNVPVKIGMLVLLAGVAALLKYASDAGMLRVPIGLRVAMVALAAIAGLAFGWKKRDSQRVFALSVQGGAIGVLVMTVFAAYRLYGLLPAGWTFALLIV